MKIFKKLYLGMMAVAMVALSGCQAEMNEPALTAPVAKNKANTTILDFKKAFLNQSVLCPMKDADSKTPYIIHGRVISSDASGNIYKSIVIQDETAAIPLSVNQGSTYVDYRIGQEVVIDCTGLWIGYYNGLQQLGWLGEPYNGETQLGFMAWDLFLGHSEKNGFPVPETKNVPLNGEWPADQPYCVTFNSFSQLPTAGDDLAKMQGQLVEFRNVYFEEGGKMTYAPYQESVNRTLKDASGGSLIVRTSGYSNFYNQLIPEGSGNVRGILSYYSGAYQLLLRGTGDVLITDKGQKKDPYTLEEALLVENTGAAGWVKGYIVGSVKAGVNEVKSNSDIVWSKDAEIDNNIVIATTADVKDWTKCMAVELPQGSAFRAKANLFDNPGVYGQEILVQGTFATYLGMAGLVGNGGTGNDVEIPGVDFGSGGSDVEGAIPTGDGTEAKPYNVTQLRGLTSGSATGVWVEGYVAGYVPAMAWADAVFGTQATEGSTNYTNGTNTILSLVPATQATLDNSAPVGLASSGDVRATLAVGKNAAIYGARVKVKGDVLAYFGIVSLKNVTEYKVITEGTGGGTGGDNPNPDPQPDNGDGTKEKPYSIQQVAAMDNTVVLNDQWMEGYVVGYVPQMTWSDAVFGKDAPSTESTNFTNGTNIVMSSAKVGSATVNNSLPVGLATAVRANLAISKNPSIYGAKVKVKGTIKKYFGVTAIRDISEYEIITPAQ